MSARTKIGKPPPESMSFSDIAASRGICYPSRLCHSAHGLLPCFQLSAPPPESPTLAADMNAVDSIPFSFALPHSAVRTESPVGRNDVRLDNTA